MNVLGLGMKGEVHGKERGGREEWETRCIYYYDIHFDDIFILWLKLSSDSCILVVTSPMLYTEWDTHPHRRDEAAVTVTSPIDPPNLHFSLPLSSLLENTFYNLRSTTKMHENVSNYIDRQYEIISIKASIST